MLILKISTNCRIYKVLNLILLETSEVVMRYFNIENDILSRDKEQKKNMAFGLNTTYLGGELN